MSDRGIVDTYGTSERRIVDIEKRCVTVGSMASDVEISFFEFPLLNVFL